MISQKIKDILSFIIFSVAILVVVWGILVGVFYIILRGYIDNYTLSLLFMLSFCFYVKAILSTWRESK